MNEKKRCGIKARLSIATGIVSIVLATGIIAGCTQDVSPDEPEQRNPVIITWNGQMDVTAGGKSLSSGQQVLEGTTITITPSPEGDPVALLLAALGQDTPPPSSPQLYRYPSELCDS